MLQPLAVEKPLPYRRQQDLDVYSNWKAALMVASSPVLSALTNMASSPAQAEAQG